MHILFLRSIALILEVSSLYLHLPLLEMQKKDLETRIAQRLEAGDCTEAQRLCNKLAVIVEQMQQA